MRESTTLPRMPKTAGQMRCVEVRSAAQNISLTRLVKSDRGYQNGDGPGPPRPMNFVATVADRARLALKQSIRLHRRSPG